MNFRTTKKVYRKQYIVKGRNKVKDQLISVVKASEMQTAGQKLFERNIEKTVYYLKANAATR